MDKGFFALVERAQVTNILKTLNSYTELPIQLIEAGGEVLLSFGETAHYCQIVRESILKDGECHALRCKAGRRASQLGEAYIYTCPASFAYIAFPLMNQGDLLATINIGPFLMEKPDSTHVSALTDRFSISAGLALELYDELFEFQVMKPEKVTQLSKLVGFLLSPLMSTERASMRALQAKTSQQSRINEAIQRYKGEKAPQANKFLYEKEMALLTKVRTGNTQEAKVLLNDLLGYVLFSEGGNVSNVRIRAMELTTLLSRVSIEGGAKVNSVYEMNDRYLSMLVNEHDFETLCYLLQDVVESFMGAMFNPTSKGNAQITRALQYMADHYTEPLTMARVAREIGLSPSYFSTLFRLTVGESFREHLMQIRVEESKHLLLSTKASLTEIAIAMGFADQSHYCKTFKRLVGMTPSKFRA